MWIAILRSGDSVAETRMMLTILQFLKLVGFCVLLRLNCWSLMSSEVLCCFWYNGVRTLFLVMFCEAAYKETWHYSWSDELLNLLSNFATWLAQFFTGDYRRIKHGLGKCRVVFQSIISPTALLLSGSWAAQGGTPCLGSAQICSLFGSPAATGLVLPSFSGSQALGCSLT